MNEKWMEKLKRNNDMVILEKYFPGQSCGNAECEKQGMEFCKILEKNIFLQKEDISQITAKQMIFPSRCPVLENPSNGNTCRFHPLVSQSFETYSDHNGRKIIGKKYITDADASKEGACKKCLEYANRIFKIPEEAHLMPKLPQHPNCKCRYEDVYAPENEKEIMTKTIDFVRQSQGNKIKIINEANSVADKLLYLIAKTEKSSSFSEFFALRYDLSQLVNNHIKLINLQINELKINLRSIIVNLNYIMQESQIETQKQRCNYLSECAKSACDILDVLKEMHYKRLSMVMQQTRYLPKNPQEARSEEAQKEGWKKATDFENSYHRNNGGINNVKYYNAKTGQEVIYESDNDDAKLVTSVDNIGTFNYYPPKEIIAHWTYDVLPYWLWGNSKEDNTSLLNRLFGVQINRLH